jgi:hypothetical protein
MANYCRAVIKSIRGTILCTCFSVIIKETLRRRITVASSLKEISTNQLGNRVFMRGRRCYSARPHPFLQQVSGHIQYSILRRREQFSSTSDIFFVSVQ